MEYLDIVLVIILLAGSVFFLIRKSYKSESCSSGCGCKKQERDK